MIELSRNEVESLAAKAAHGAGFAWGLADDIGRAARLLAQEGADWSAVLLSLLERAPGFGLDKPPFCPVRLAARLNDAPPETDGLVLRDVGLPVWLDAMLRTQGLLRANGDLQAATGHVTLTRVTNAAAVARRATISRHAYDALNAFAARIYVPESDRSRTRGAGGGSIDEE